MKLKEILDYVSPGQTFKLHSVTVMGPYPTADFILSINDLKPKELVLYADDGVPDDVLQDISSAFPARGRTRLKLQRVAPEKGNGLVHAKVYLFEWKNGDANNSTQTKRCVLVGSANASMQGFSLHAETFLATRVFTQSDLSGVLHYFDDLRSKGAVPAACFDLNGSGALWLPAVKVVPKSTVDSFDAWLRRGILCHRYEGDQSFGKLSVRLKKPLPVGVEAEAFVKSEFSRESESTKLVRPYVQLEVDIVDSAPPWRAQYFVETYFGFWASDDCYENLKRENIIFGKGQRKRALVLEEISQSGPEVQETWISEMLERVSQAAEMLGDSAVEYLDMKNGRLNERAYRESARKKLMRDMTLSNNSIFRQRYLSGYDFQRVPALNEHFDGFVESLCNTLLAGVRKERPKSKLVHVLKYFDGIIDCEDSEALREWLRDAWFDVRELIVPYYKAVSKNVS
ncbi:hypothetical protein GPA27_16320 [Aromatoleum toluolicum]|uniref:PLD phosphodiesterase domain-containing protein n=1 Tax=Aromatoleum toluolicum TaxID=90060 RepID=A0ABX1NIM1_9RHOO|nr:hypothetical protein [Aromatoleum toluolicum]NMF98945.1 hypothetical protein [Aromatoleum toluolicum]